MAEETTPENSPIDLTHPDLVVLSSKNDVHYVWEFSTTKGTGPHVARTSLHAGSDIRKNIQLLLLSHSHILPDWKKGFQAFPTIFGAIAESESRKKKLYLADPGRAGAEEMYPDAPNRILEEDKPQV